MENCKKIIIILVILLLCVGFARADVLTTEHFTIYYPQNTNLKKLNKLNIEEIFRKAQMVLDMYPGNMQIIVKVFETPEEVNQMYSEICGQKESAISFYVHKDRTIYISFKKISERVLAHEIGHSIVDHYFIILPPRKIQELLATYVETHLED